MPAATSRALPLSGTTSLILRCRSTVNPPHLDPAGTAETRRDRPPQFMASHNPQSDAETRSPSHAMLAGARMLEPLME